MEFLVYKMNRISLKAYAKINIGLNVVAKRQDGYHEIETIFQQIDLHDNITISSRVDTKIVLASDSKNIPLDENNICFKTTKLLQEISGVSRGVTIAISKRIPIGAGLGGGSSDAAATLKGLLKQWELTYTENEITKIAKQIGADVPFFIKGGTAYATGIGDKLTQIKSPPKYFYVLVYPNIKISTKWAYKNINFNLTKTKKIIKLSEILHKKSDFFELKNFAQNDFEEVVFREYPELYELKEMLYQSGAFFACMSGSGSTIFGMFREYHEAEDAVGIFPKSYQTFLTQPI